MGRYQILPIAMRERTQIEEKLIEESPFDVFDVEKQLLLDMAKDMKLRAPSIQNDSHTSFQHQESAQDSSSHDLLDQDQQQRDALHEKARKNQAHANKRAVKGYSKCHSIITFKVGDHVSIAVPPHDRGPTDPKRIFGKVFSVDEDRPDLYEIITPYGILNRLYPTKKLLSLPNSIPLEIPTR